ncbi:OmpA family protein [Ancylomarina sp. YFZ004]
MKKIACIILFIGILFSSFSVKAQIAERANKCFESFAYQEAIELYEILWQKDSLNESVAKRLATSYRLINNSEQTERWYARVVKMSSAENDDFLYYAKALQSNKKYNQAQIWMDKYLKGDSKVKLTRIDPINISDLMKDSIRYKVQAIKANSEASDFGVCFYKNQLVFSSAREKNTLIKRNHKWNNQNYLRLYKANVEADGELMKIRLFENKLATNYHDGPVCFNEEGDEMFLTRNHVSNSKRVKRNQEGIVSIKLYYCKKEGNKWSEPKLLPFNMDGYSTGHPALSSDAKSLYFISDRPGGFGGTDLYVCHRNENGWGIIENLGSHINTFENEMFPFVTENQNLYFASKGHVGLGGLDLFSIDLNQKDSKPINLGYPVNTSKDDFGLIIKNGKGYFASNRLKGQSFDDIYKFSIESSLVRGQVFHAVTNEVLGNTLVTLNDENDQPIERVTTEENGKFEFLVHGGQTYQIRSVKESFIDGEAVIADSALKDKTDYYIPVHQATENTLFFEGLLVLKEGQSPIEGLTISVQDNQTKEKFELLSDIEGIFSCQLKRETQYKLAYRKESLMSKYDEISTYNLTGNKIHIREEFDRLEVGKTFVLENILYDLNKSNIREDAAMELGKLVLIMEDNPSLKIELSSHTDSRGSDAYNLALSQRRAKSAVAFIISKGISKDRVVAKGYGESKLINRCLNGVVCSKAEHQANRRTEIKILRF